MTNTTNYEDELDFVDKEYIRRAARPLGYYDGADNAMRRYAFYRRRGHDKAAAMRYTLAWCRNMASQRAGRTAHLTGAI